MNDVSAGGGKGGLSIPPKRARGSAAPEQHAGQTSSRDEKGKKGEDKRVLRSHDSKLTEYAEWLEPEDGGMFFFVFFVLFSNVFPYHLAPGVLILSLLVLYGLIESKLIGKLLYRCYRLERTNRTY